MSVQSSHEPESFAEAFNHSCWRDAMQEEINAQEKKNEKDLVSLPAGKEAIGCKWIYKIKHKADGSVERYKARLVAKGFLQEY